MRVPAEKIVAIPPVDAVSVAANSAAPTKALDAICKLVPWIELYSLLEHFESWYVVKMQNQYRSQYPCMQLMTEAIWQAAVCAASALSDQDRLSNLWVWMQRFHTGWHASTGEAQVSLSLAIVDSRPSKGALAQNPDPEN